VLLFKEELKPVHVVGVLLALAGLVLVGQK
jgi:hypothetical protein